jgi:glycosyltransferase involved in cell wall biosynthesis
MTSPPSDNTPKLRLLMLGRSLEHRRVGGIVYVSRQLLAHLDEGRFDVRYLANGAGREGLLGGAVRLLTFPVDLATAWRYLRKFGPDVVHINTSLDWRSLLRDSCFLVLARTRCDHIVLFIHGWQWKLGRRLQSRHHALRWFCRRVFGLAQQLVVLSRSFANVMEEMGLPGERIHVVPNPVDCGAFPRPAAAMNPDDQQVWRLLFMARFVAEKGFYELIDAMPGLRDACDRPVELILAGDGPEREGAERRCRELGLDDAVVFPGYVTDEQKQKLFESVHVFVFPSRYGEGRPIVLLEAMAAGLPLLATRAGGIGEFVRDGEHGVLLSDTSAADIERGVLSLLRDPQRLAEIGRGNREYARLHFDSARIAGMLEDIYRWRG